MGKYMMRKAKFTDDVAVMEVSQSTSTAIGVRTRAKTLALQRLQSSSTTAPPSPQQPPSSDLVSDSSCYLELRSRRLEKPLRLKTHSQKSSHLKQSSAHEAEINTNPRSGGSSRLRLNNSASSGSVKSASIARPKVVVEDCFENRVPDETEQGFDLSTEDSFGENNLDFQPRERYFFITVCMYYYFLFSENPFPFFF